MIKKIEIDSFKCFSVRTDISLSQITVCTGMNSVGKSTLVQALLLMWQSYEKLKKNTEENEIVKVLLNTSALKLGSTDQIMTAKSMTLSADEASFKYFAGNDKLSLDLEKDDDLAVYSLFDSMLYYLNAERLGPRNYQEMFSLDALHCGYHGEYTFDVVQKNPFVEISENRCFRSDSGKTIRELAKQIDYWMSYIVNGVEVNFTSDLATQLAQMKVRQAVLDTPFNSPYNFGFGISYVLPIITTGLVAEHNTVFIVENPEAHLHPAGQSRIGEFLAQISRDNVQVIIETHSEHVLNGIRKYALKYAINADDICVNYFSIARDTQKHEVKRLLLNERMDILSWPEGFFDQEANDLKELRILRGTSK